MLIGASVLAFLVLLALLGERGGDRLWHAGHADALFYCGPCDLRYRRDELIDQTDRVCPHGHYVDRVAAGYPMGTVAIVACIAFILLAVLMTVTGAVPHLP